MIDVDKVVSRRDTALIEVSNSESKNRELGKTAKASREFVQKAQQFLKAFDFDGLTQKQEKIDSLGFRSEMLRMKKKSFEKELQRYKKKERLLEKHEYDPDCSYCSSNEFVKDAQEAKQSIPKVIKKIGECADTIERLDTERNLLDPAQVTEHLQKYNMLIDKVSENETEIRSADLQIAKNKNQIIRLKSEVKDLNLKIAEYEENREAIENLEALLSEKEALSAQVEARS